MIEAAIDTRNPKLEGWAFMTTYTSGWSKAHYFRGNRSLCKRWPMFTPREGYQLDNDTSPDNCIACKRCLAKEREPG